LRTEIQEEEACLKIKAVTPEWWQLVSQLEAGKIPKGIDDLSLCWNTCAIGERLGWGPKRRPNWKLSFDKLKKRGVPSKFLMLGLSFYANLGLERWQDVRRILSEIEAYPLIITEQSAEKK